MEHIIFFCIRYFSKLTLVGIVVFGIYKFYEYWNFLRSHDGLPTFKGLSLLTYYKIMNKFTREKAIPAECYGFQLLNAFCQLCKDGFFVFWIFLFPYVFVYKAEIMKELISHPEALKKPLAYVVLKPSLGSGLITSSGNLWYSHRRLITPSFQLQALKEYTLVFNEQANLLVEKLMALVDEPWIELKDIMERCTFDTICETILGLKTGCQSGNVTYMAVLNAVDELENIATYRSTRPWTYNEFLFRLSSTGRRMHLSDKLAKDIINKALNELQKSHNLKAKAGKEAKGTSEDIVKKKKSFVELLFECHAENPEFSYQHLQDEVYTFMSAGFSTVASSLKWTLLLLGLDSDAQEKLIQELDTFLEKDKKFVTYETLNRMTYLDCVVKESLRLYPPVPIVGRELSKDVTIGKCNIPGGTTLIFNFYMLHRDPKYFAEPEVFRPERFLPENSSAIPPFAYLPFSAGPRNCIGQKFALLEAKVILCHIFRRFRIESLDHRDKINTIWGIALKNVEPIKSRLIPRL